MPFHFRKFDLMKKKYTLLLFLIPFFIKAQSSRVHLDLVVNQHIKQDEISSHVPLEQEGFLSFVMQDFKSASLQVFYEMNEAVDLGAGVTYAQMNTLGIFDCRFCLVFGNFEQAPVRRSVDVIQFPILVNFYPFGKQHKITPFLNGSFIPTKIKKPPLGAENAGAHINYSFGSGVNVRVFPWMKWGLEANFSHQSVAIEEVEGYGRFIGLGSRLSFHFIKSKT